MSLRAACAAPGARSWVGWVRVAGAAGVIDALVAWQGQAISVAGSAGTVEATPLRRGRFVLGIDQSRIPGPQRGSDVLGRCLIVRPDRAPSGELVHGEEERAGDGRRTEPDRSRARRDPLDAFVQPSVEVGVARPEHPASKDDLDFETGHVELADQRYGH